MPRKCTKVIYVIMHVQKPSSGPGVGQDPAAGQDVEGVVRQPEVEGKNKRYVII